MQLQFYPLDPHLVHVVLCQAGRVERVLGDGDHDARPLLALAAANGAAAWVGHQLEAGPAAKELARLPTLNSCNLFYEIIFDKKFKHTTCKTSKSMKSAIKTI